MFINYPHLLPMKPIEIKNRKKVLKPKLKQFTQQEEKPLTLSLLEFETVDHKNHKSRKNPNKPNNPTKKKKERSRSKSPSPTRKRIRPMATPKGLWTVEPVQQVLMNLSHRFSQVPDPLLIFHQPLRWNPNETMMRTTFFDQYQEMIHHCRFSIDPKLRPYLHANAQKSKEVRIPLDIDPLLMNGPITFIDYMNIFPHFQKELLVSDSWKPVDVIFNHTSYADKITNLYRPEYLVALIYYAYRKCGNLVPQPDDWIIVVCQGSQSCGKVTFQEIPFLQHCKVLIIEVPCVIRGTGFIKRYCHEVYHKNETDDYYMMYFVAYLDYYRSVMEDTALSLRKIAVEIPFSPTRSQLESNIALLENFLKTQQIRIVSYDDYSWTNGSLKTRIVKSPSWKMTGGFSMGKIGDRNPTTGGSSRFSHLRKRHR